MNRERAPSGPVKVVVTNRPHSRRHNGIELVSGVSALLAWFPASWASKIAPCFIGEEGGSIQLLQEVAIVCPHREFEGLQRDAVDQVLLTQMTLVLILNHIDARTLWKFGTLSFIIVAVLCTEYFQTHSTCC